MSNVAIRVEGLGKEYRIGSKQEKYKTFRDAVTQTALWPLRMTQSLIRRDGSHRGANESIWALKDVSFEIKHGEAVGIIGHNGAGKSTLLKILSRITEPTEGYADMFGRVGALLEVGTGFHPELTGRENIYLNGAILGMRRAEIDRRFDEIVAFSEIEKFIDTPVKHYSSGMGLRLGFAVAAHLEPEILVVDEVLAVGDLAFQQKCLGKMEDVAHAGRTVLFVSHNMAAVSNLCQTAYLLDQGNIQETGFAPDVIAHYMQLSGNLLAHSLSDRVDRAGTGAVRFMEVRVHNSQGIPTSIVAAGEDITIELDYFSERSDWLGGVLVSIVVSSQMGTKLFCCFNDTISTELGRLKPIGTLACRIPKLPLSAANYSISLAMAVEGQTMDKISEAAVFTVVEGDFFGTGKLPPPHLGSFLVRHTWAAF